MEAQNGVSSSVLSITPQVLQRSVLGPLVLIYINDLTHVVNVVKHSTVDHFDGDNNLLYCRSLFK